MIDRMRAIARGELADRSLTPGEAAEWVALHDAAKALVEPYRADGMGVPAFCRPLDAVLVRLDESEET